MERAAGIEPACLTWKDSALPLSYARDFEPNRIRCMDSPQAFFPVSLNFAELVERPGQEPLMEVGSQDFLNTILVKGRFS